MTRVLLYDGVCGLCNRLVQFVLRRDRAGAFQFAALQSDFARAALARHGIEATELNTMYVLADAPAGSAQGEAGGAERIFAKSDAAIYVLRQLGGFWRVLALARVLPRFLRNWVYELVARNRYRVFGRSDACMLPPAGSGERFLDTGQ